MIMNFVVMLFVVAQDLSRPFLTPLKYISFYVDTYDGIVWGCLLSRLHHN